MRKFIFSKIVAYNFIKNEILQRYFSKIATTNFPWPLSEQHSYI